MAEPEQVTGELVAQCPALEADVLELMGQRVKLHVPGTGEIPGKLKEYRADDGVVIVVAGVSTYHINLAHVAVLEETD